MEEKGVYQFDDKPSGEIDEDFSKSKTYYTNEPYDKLNVNFMGIESICDRCTPAFSFRSAPYKYIKTGCVPLRENIAEKGLGPSSTRPILKSIVKFFAPGSGLIFRGESSLTTFITFNPTALLFLTDPNGWVCLNIRCGVTLVDKAWLAKKLPSQKISRMPVFLIFKSIGASKHELGNFAFTTIYILAIHKKAVRSMHLSAANCTYLTDWRQICWWVTIYLTLRVLLSTSLPPPPSYIAVV